MKITRGIYIIENLVGPQVVTVSQKNTKQNEKGITQECEALQNVKP